MASRADRVEHASIQWQTMTRLADELLDTPDPAWPLLERMLREAGPTVRLLAGSEPAGRREIESLQVSGKSFLGAMAYHVGGLIIDSGWLRVLGCGHAECAWSIVTGTQRVGWGTQPGAPEGLVVGVDVLGGLFAINAGFRTDVPPGQVAYFGPDTLRWEDTGSGYSAWLEAMLDSDRRAKFYADLRWAGWEREVGALPPNTGLSVYPPMWTRESRPLEATRRAPVPLNELVWVGLDMARQLGK